MQPQLKTTDILFVRVAPFEIKCRVGCSSCDFHVGFGFRVYSLAANEGKEIVGRDDVNRLINSLKTKRICFL
jgi:hypothetical protein